MGKPTRLCANGCGFHGSAAHNNLCSKCYSDLLKSKLHELLLIQPTLTTKPNSSIQDLSSSSATATTNSSIQEASSMMRNRCESCNKKVGLTGFKCRCGNMYCGRHRYPEEHCCPVDFKGIGRQILEKQNPLVKADKLTQRL